MEPRKFCEKYARMKEGEYGYKGNWVRVLAHTLEISVKTVETWGTPPDFPKCDEKYKKELARINALLEAEQLLAEQGLNAEYLKRLE
ncbi:hypothetical protein [Leptolyngbya ohadii]|uniref:hypothetical protein n=1 Tax=Leptolyngbya ohadii TaxID=1962290 RepID=UPI001179A308|nr:hypothetical protein [Leptolyngbya ohadii]